MEDIHKPRINIATIILAAGRSSRMGQPKQLLPYNGNPLLYDICQKIYKLPITTDAIFCITGYEREKIETVLDLKKIASVFNSNYKEGMSSSIVCGIKHLLPLHNIDGVLIVLSDQPTIPLSHYQDMILEFKKTDKSIISTSYNSSYGAPAIFRKSLFPELLKLDQDMGAKKLIAQNIKNVHFIQCDEAENDIDTIEDYERLIRK